VTSTSTMISFFVSPGVHSRVNQLFPPRGLSAVSKAILSVALLAAFTMPKAWAGVYTDELSKCLVESTSPDDRTALVKWLFTAASAHPAIGSLYAAKPEDKEAANQAIGGLFMKLLTESCKAQTQKALRYEGPATIQLSFTVLGQVAGAELFSNPAVAREMSGIEKFFDARKLEALTAETTPDG
jgi:hypothetical protein